MPNAFRAVHKEKFLHFYKFTCEICLKNPASFQCSTTMQNALDVFLAPICLVDYVISFKPEEMLTRYFLMKYTKKQTLNLSEVGSN